MPQEEEKLKQIYRLMYEKLSEIQLGNAFEETMEENRKFSYVGKDDDYFFAKMVSVVFESGIRAIVWDKYESEVRKEFKDYDVKKAARFSAKDIERMLKNPKMFKHRRKLRLVFTTLRKWSDYPNNLAGSQISLCIMKFQI